MKLNTWAKIAEIQKLERQWDLLQNHGIVAKGSGKSIDDRCREIGREIDTLKGIIKPMTKVQQTSIFKKIGMIVSGGRKAKKKKKVKKDGI